MKVKMILAALILLSFVSFSQSQIEGTVKNAAGKKIHISTYSDMISYLDKPLTIAEIDDDGTFAIQFPLEKTGFYFISINFQKTEFYLQPDNNYLLNIEYDTENPQISFTNPVPLKYELIKPDSGLNQNIQVVNAIYNDFILGNFNAIYKRKQKHLLDSLKKYINKSIYDTSNAYLKAYIRYKIASVEQFARIKSREKIATEYLFGNEVLYNNVEYMAFFNQYFDKYFAATTRTISWDELSHAINEMADFSAFMELVEKDTLLSKDLRILEMVVLKELQNIFYLEGMDQENILMFLGMAGESFKFPENRDIAHNIIQKLTYLKPGTKAPVFQLPDFMGNLIKLSELTDRITFIDFWNLSCKPCLDELDSIASYKDQLNNSIRFVSISTDDNPIAAQQFITQKEYDWIFLHFNENYQFLKDYQVRTYPHNIIIDQNGKVLKYPAKLPGESLKAMLRNIGRLQD